MITPLSLQRTIKNFFFVLNRFGQGPKKKSKIISQNYNMAEICLERKGFNDYSLLVPGLSEKRPSLMVGKYEEKFPSRTLDTLTI